MSRASARKSYGSYKPVIVHDSGSTETLGGAGRVSYKRWADGRPDPRSMYVRHERGLTFATREEAAAYAQRVLDERREESRKHAGGAP